MNFAAINDSFVNFRGDMNVAPISENLTGFRLGVNLSSNDMSFGNFGIDFALDDGNLTSLTDFFDEHMPNENNHPASIVDASGLYDLESQYPTLVATPAVAMAPASRLYRNQGCMANFRRNPDLSG